MNVLEILAAYGVGFVTGATTIAFIWWRHVNLLSDTMNSIHDAYNKEIASIHNSYQATVNAANAKVDATKEKVQQVVDKAIGN